MRLEDAPKEFYELGQKHGRQMGLIDGVVWALSIAVVIAAIILLAVKVV